MSATESAPAPERASRRTWIAVFGCMLGALMSVLDIQVTNSSLPQIEGGIGTGIANGAWISTAYLIGEIIMIPLADYFSRVFSFRRFMLGSTVMFLVFSVGCAFATNLTEMIVLRGLQGFSAGALVPMAMTYVLAKLPPSQQSIGIAIFAMTATFGPAIGPTLGGYLTDQFGWQYVFFINLVPGAVMLALLIPTLDKEDMQLGLLKHGDWFGIVFLAVGLACLQTMLDEGNRFNWFGSPYIVHLALVAAVCLCTFIAIELTIKNPVLNLRLLLNRNFGLGTIANVLVGFVLFGVIYVLPTYLGEVQGYDAGQTGNVMAWAGVPQLFIIPLVPLLLARFDARWVTIAGLLLFATSCFMTIHLDQNFGGEQLRSSNLVRALGQAILLSPLTVIALYGLTPAQSGQASGLFNMLRSLGGAVGTAILATIITKREQFHAAVISQSNTPSSPTVEKFLSQMQAYFMQHGMTDPTAARHQAEIAMGELINRQALAMGYSDAFFTMGVILLIAIIFVVPTRSTRGQAAL